MTALRTLLAGIVDYAGLFPPAALDMTTAVRNYADYCADANGWMLGRFVVPVERLGELESAMEALGQERIRGWRLTALLGPDAAADIGRARAFNAANDGRAVIDSLEGKFATPGAIEAGAAAAGRDFALFAEVLVDDQLPALVAAMALAGINAKIRTGGVVPQAVPPATTVVRFIRACVNGGVPFKATAGLHHPLRAEYRMTYDVAAPVGVMFGYLNVFLAAALMANGLPDNEAVQLLEERNSSAFEIVDDAIWWRHHSLNAGQIRRARERVAVSFGSCSFREPVDELRALTTV